MEIELHNTRLLVQGEKQMTKLALPLLLGCVLSAQVQNAPPPPAGESQPVFRVTVVERTTNAVSYRHRSGWTKVDLHGTPLAPQATGHADVNSRPGYIEIKTQMHHLESAQRYGPEYLTYVLWAITPEGRSKNLGEVVLEDGNSHLDVTTDLQAFALIVTAEPYFGVSQPSDVVVMENEVRPDTVGSIEEVDAKFDLLERGDYSTITTGNESARLDPRVPLSLYEARNAVEIAQAAGSDKYATASFEKAQQLLQSAEDAQKHKAAHKDIDMTAREAVQTAQDARSITLKRLGEERQQAEQRAAEAREALAKQQAADALKAKLEAQLAEEQAAREKAEAEAAREAAQKSAALAAEQQAAAEAAAAQTAQQAAQAAELAAQQKSAADAETERARQAAAQAEAEKGELRKQLLAQLSSILQTRDSARGLIVNMSDVLFDTGSYTLKAGAREKLAKISGILLAYPALKIQVEGHTDSVGGDDYNQRLSEQRAQSVREYLVDQMVSADSVTAFGFGKSRPVATNDTPEGRQQNRRVELVVSGEAIGQNLGAGADETQ
jgi:outer membrane protein OmpA-like peptidoglycan-associated protein